MGNRRPLATLDRPPSGAQPVTEVRILGSANVLPKASKRLERDPAESGVSGLRKSPGSEPEGVVLTHRSSDIGEASSRRTIARDGLVANAARDDRGALVRHRIEVSI